MIVIRCGNHLSHPLNLLKPDDCPRPKGGSEREGGNSLSILPSVSMGTAQTRGSISNISATVIIWWSCTRPLLPWISTNCMLRHSSTLNGISMISCIFSLPHSARPVQRQQLDITKITSFTVCLQTVTSEFCNADFNYDIRFSPTSQPRWLTGKTFASGNRSGIRSYAELNLRL